ncbi:MAG: hypothetical protein PHP17_03295 [Candidatus Omnitrophica bacterium]|nr:hypothetical protein [Candidatus Omnitrophota bacterium]
MKKFLFVLLLLQTFSFSLPAQERDFYIEIFPEKKVFKKGEIFTVKTSIMNVTPKEQRLCFWNCSYDQNWVLEDELKKVQLYGVACDKNVVSCITLLPMEKFEKELYLQVSDTAKRGKTSFKLGFMPCVSREECFETESANPEKFFSQEAVITIR